MKCVVVKCEFLFLECAERCNVNYNVALLKIYKIGTVPSSSTNKNIKNTVECILTVSFCQHKLFHSIRQRSDYGTSLIRTNKQTLNLNFPGLLSCNFAVVSFHYDCKKKRFFHLVWLSVSTTSALYF